MSSNSAMSGAVVPRGDERRSVVLEEPVARGLTYTEELIDRPGQFQERHCCLKAENETEPVSDLELLSFKLRFGATALPVEGVGGVQTRLQHQRRGYLRLLMSRALESAGSRVGAAFLYGTPGLYPKWGFTTCATSSRIKLEVADFVDLGTPPTVRPAVAADLPTIVALYNRAHGCRPWTVERDPSWNRLVEPKVWQPGSEVFVHEAGGEIAAYAIARGHSPRWGHRNLMVEELGAVDPDAAAIMLRYLANVCWEAKREQFTVFEPIDSAAGIAARRVRCEVVTHYFVDSDFMGVILDRNSLVESLQSELHRRAKLSGIDQRASHDAIAPLRSGQLVPDDGELLRLMVGYQAAGHIGDSDDSILLHAWFPGGGSSALPIPYPHTLDHY